MKRLITLSAAAVLVLSACSSGASTCEELADEAIDLIQALIDDVDAELGNASFEDLAATGGDLPAVEEYEEQAAALDERGEELGCTDAQIQELVAERSDQLRSESVVGQLIIDSIESGGL